MDLATALELWAQAAAINLSVANPDEAAPILVGQQGDPTFGDIRLRLFGPPPSWFSDPIARSEDSLGASIVVKGSDGNDVLRGGKGWDALAGYDGADTLTGWSGDDMLYGSSYGARSDGARDVFVYPDDVPGGNENDTIRDFEAGIDRLDLRDLGIQDPASFVADSVMNFDSQSIVNLGADGTIGIRFLNGSGSLSINDFIFA